MEIGQNMKGEKHDQPMTKGVFNIISIRQLSIKSGVAYQRLYENINGVYDTLDVNEKTSLANTLAEETHDLYKFLGFRQEIHRVKGQE